MRSVPSWALAIRLSIAIVVTAVLLVGIFQAIDGPTQDSTLSYDAMFTDANGLQSGDDVRIHGVRVGRVGGITLQGTEAKVSFSLRADIALTSSTRLAIRYQNMTGQRYLDVQGDTTWGTAYPAGQVVGIEQTVPSFDITTLFNGLQPALKELTPEDLNSLAMGLTAMIEGDGSGLGPALGAIEQLSRHVANRQVVISTLVENLGTASRTLAGRSENSLILVQQLVALFESLYQRLPSMIEFAEKMPEVLDPIWSLMQTLGLTTDPNPMVQDLVTDLFSNTDDVAETMTRLPAVIQTLAAAVPTEIGESSCTRGQANVPAALEMILRDQRIVLCQE